MQSNSILLVILALLAATGASAQDSTGVVGTRLGCVRATVSATGWTYYTSASMTDATGTAALPAGLYVMEVTLQNEDTTDAAYLCLGSSCGTATTSKPLVPVGGARTVSARAVSTSTGARVQSVGVYGAGTGTDVMVCAYYRTTT
jgi:hypothetical protein